MRELAKPLTIGKSYEKSSFRKKSKKLIYNLLPFLLLVLFCFGFFPLKGFTSAPETNSDKFTKCYAISVSGAKELPVFSDCDLLVEKGSIL